MANAIPATIIPAAVQPKAPADPTKGRSVVYIPPGFDACIYSEDGMRMFSLDEADARGLVIKHVIGRDIAICLNYQGLRVRFTRQS